MARAAPRSSPTVAPHLAHGRYRLHGGRLPTGVRAGLLPGLELASLALRGEGAGSGIQATCTVGVVHPSTAADAGLRAIAEGGPHGGLERDTLTVELSVGRVIRSSAFRFVDELLADETVVPFAAEIRFALPLPGRRIGVLHFETASLRCFEELESLFDTIAGTARVA